MRTRLGATGGSTASWPGSESELAASTIWGDPAGGRHRSGTTPLIGDLVCCSSAARPAALSVCDFFTVETVLLRRFYVLVFIELATRKVCWPGVTANPTSEWATQQARNIIETFIDRSEPIRFLIHDRDSKFTACGGRNFGLRETAL